MKEHTEMSRKRGLLLNLRTFQGFSYLVSAQHYHPRGNGSYLPHGRGGGQSTADLGAATLATAGSCSVNNCDYAGRSSESAIDLEPSDEC